MSASDSGERSATRDNRVPDWFAKLVIAVLAAIGAGLGGWALKATQDHDGRLIRLETQYQSNADILREIKDDLKEIKATLARKP